MCTIDLSIAVFLSQVPQRVVCETGQGFIYFDNGNRYITDRFSREKLQSENTGLISKIDTNDESVSLLKSQLEGLSVAVRGLEKDVEKLEEGDKNPLAN